MDLFRYNKALHFANRWHKGEFYTTDPELPFISHPYFVASLLERYGFSEDVVIAGLVHDVVEDTDCSLAEIEKEFGQKVASIVQEVTFDQSKTWEERQYMMRRSAEKASPEAKAVKIADIIHHLIMLIGYVDEGKGSKYFVRRTQHTADEYVWKYGGLIKAISQNWEYPILKEAQELFETFKNKTKPDEQKVECE